MTIKYKYKNSAIMRRKKLNARTCTNYRNDNTKQIFKSIVLPMLNSFKNLNLPIIKKTKVRNLLQ